MAAPNAILEVRPAVTYSSQMTEVRQTPIFRKWLDDLTDRRAAERIAQRIVRLQSGLIGDAKPVGGGISELRVDYGPGYRVYFVQRGMVLIILLCGGDKRSQSRDIVRARTLAEELEDD
jgi:putative addiction module killer protein